MLVWNESKNTEKELETIKQITEPEVKPYISSKEDEEIIWFITTRKRLMAAKRSQMDKSWKQYQKQYEALFVPYSDWRSSSNVPLERAIVELFVAEAIKRPTTYNFNAWIEYDFQSQVLERVWEDDWSINNRDNEILDNEYLTAIYGTSIIYNGYKRSYRVIEDFDWYNEETGKIDYERKMQTKSDILLENIDIRYFWIDERANSIEKAIDCIYESYITYEEFREFYLDNEYDDEKLNAIVPTYQKQDEHRPYVINEERWDWEAKFVKITQYWNTKLDRHYTIANENVLIKKHPILNATHCIPFTPRQYGKNLFSIYWYGLCEALVTFKSDINNLREMLMEAIKKSNQDVIALWNWLEFDGNKFAYNNQFITFKGNLQWNFHQLSWTPPNQSIFTYLQELFKQIAIFTGIDIMNILWEPQQTAYQTAVQKESSLQRVNVVLKNRDAAFERIANQHKDNLQMFYPLKLVRELVKVDKENNPMEEWEAKYPTIETTKVKGKRFAKDWIKEVFEVTPEKIRWKIKIDVSTDLNTPTINEVEKAQKSEFFIKLAEITNAYNADKDLESIIPKKKAIMDLAELNNIDIMRSDNNEVAEEKQKLYEELQSMMKGTRTPQQRPNFEWIKKEAELQNMAQVAPEAAVQWELPTTPNIAR